MDACSETWEGWDEIAEHVVEKHVSRGILIQQITVLGSTVRQALHVMKDAT